MPKFYFTYGTEEQPFRGGWSEVIAPDMGTACDLFRVVHPCKESNLLNCSCVYSEEDMMRTDMFINGNFGHKAHEVIELTITKLE